MKVMSLQAASPSPGIPPLASACPDQHFSFVADMLHRAGKKRLAPHLPCEGVPCDYQAVGPFVGSGNPPSVFPDAEAGDHISMALQKCRENALKHSGWPERLEPHREN